MMLEMIVFVLEQMPSLNSDQTVHAQITMMVMLVIITLLAPLITPK